jgi:hypothetical protein
MKNFYFEPKQQFTNCIIDILPDIHSSYNMQYGASTYLNLLKSLQIKGPLAIMNHYKIKKDHDANDETTETSTRPKSYTHHEAAVVRSTFSFS